MWWRTGSYHFFLSYELIMPVPAVRSKWHQWMYVAFQKFHSTQSQVSYLDVSTINLQLKKSKLNTISSFQRAKLSNKRSKRTSDQPELLSHLHKISGKIYLIMTWTEDRSITAMLDIQSFPGGSGFHPVRSLPHSWPNLLKHSLILFVTSEGCGKQNAKTPLERMNAMWHQSSINPVCSWHVYSTATSTSRPCQLPHLSAHPYIILQASTMQAVPLEWRCKCESTRGRWCLS